MAPIINVDSKLFISLENVVCITFDLKVDENNKKKRNATIYFANRSKPLVVKDEDGGRALFNKIKNISMRNK